jgi:hypothetical protein
VRYIQRITSLREAVESENEGGGPGGGGGAHGAQQGAGGNP